jgi:hypothetical protein
MKKVVWSWIGAAALTGILCVSGELAAAAQGDQANKPEVTKTRVPTAGSPPSDRFVDYIHTIVNSFLIPEEIERKDGTKFKVNRSDEAEMKQFEIPREDMRRIIHIAYTGAIAERCNRTDLQNGLALWLQANEYKKKKWSERQSFFITQVYWGTIMTLTQRADIIENDAAAAAKAAKTAKTGSEPAARAKTQKKATAIVCTDAKREFVGHLEKFLKAESKS